MTFSLGFSRSDQCPKCSQYSTRTPNTVGPNESTLDKCPACNHSTTLRPFSVELNGFLLEDNDRYSRVEFLFTTLNSVRHLTLAHDYSTRTVAGEGVGCCGQMHAQISPEEVGTARAVLGITIAYHIVAYRLSLMFVPLCRTVSRTAICRTER